MSIYYPDRVFDYTSYQEVEPGVYAPKPMEFFAYGCGAGGFGPTVTIHNLDGTVHHVSRTRFKRVGIPKSNGTIDCRLWGGEE